MFDQVVGAVVAPEEVDFVAGAVVDVEPEVENYTVEG